MRPDQGGHTADVVSRNNTLLCLRRIKENLNQRDRNSYRDKAIVDLHAYDIWHPWSRIVAVVVWEMAAIYAIDIHPSYVISKASSTQPSV